MLYNIIKYLYTTIEMTFQLTYAFIGVLKYSIIRIDCIGLVEPHRRQSGNG